MSSFNQFLFQSFWWLCKHINMSFSASLVKIALKDKVFPKKNFDPVLSTTILGRTFATPVGVAGGIDKKGVFMDELIRIGFGFGEIGSLTLQPCFAEKKEIYYQRKKSIFSQPVAYYNKGIDAVYQTLVNRHGNNNFVGINVAPLPDNVSATFTGKTGSYEEELSEMAHKCAPYCDYFVLNLTDAASNLCRLISDESTLLPLLLKLKETLVQSALQNPPKFLVKVPLTLTPMEVPLVINIFTKAGVDGVIVGGGLTVDKNTPLLSVPQRGILCGKVIKDKNTELIRQFYQQTQGRLPIIACGGVLSGQDAFEKIAAGASLVQCYSALLYRGPLAGAEISNELARVLKSKGYRSVSEAVGCEYI